MKIYVINLDKDIDRFKFSKEQAIKNNYEIERVKGVYGKNLTAEEISKSVNKLRFNLAVGRDPLLGEIGCGLSHLSIYRKMIEENIPFACILEDDIIVLDGFIEKLHQLEQSMNKDKPQVVRLNYSAEKVSECRNGLYRTYSKTSACSYCITIQAARVLLRENYPLKTPSDWWPRWAKYGLVELYDCDKKVCWHNNAESGFSSVIVTSKDLNKSKDYLLKKALNKLIRFTAYSMDKLILFFRFHHF